MKKRANIGELMKNGQGLKGFEWPENCGDFDMRIARDGTWFYQGSPIGRKELCQLFATVLQRDNKGKYWLVTPAERGEIMVDDAPFTAVEMHVDNKGNDKTQKIHFRTNLDHWICVDAAHEITVKFSEGDRTPAPCVHVRDGLCALIVRSVFYDLVELANLQETINGKILLNVFSNGKMYFIGECDKNDLS